MHPSTTSASLAAALAASVLVGCGGNVDFSIQRNLNVDSTVNAGTISSDVDLAAEAGRAWKERKHIDRITIRGATATVVDADWQGNNSASQISGTVRLQELGDPSRFVDVGSWTGVDIVENEFIALTPSAALDDFLTAQLKGDGKFTVIATGAVAGTGTRVSVTLHVVIDATLKWSTF